MRMGRQKKRNRAGRLGAAAFAAFLLLLRFLWPEAPELVRGLLISGQTEQAAAVFFRELTGAEEVLPVFGPSSG